MAKKRIHAWVKFGAVWIFEGHHALAVGNKPTGFSVFSSKAHVNISSEGKVRFPETAGYMGHFNSRRKASGLVKAIDESFAKKGESTTFTITGDTDEAFDAFSQSHVKTGGSILVYEEGDVEGESHERGHLIMGHLKRGVKSSKKETKRRGPRSGVKEEKEAVRVQIGLLKERGEYNKEIRKSIIRNLATYMHGTTTQKLRRAREYVRSVE